MQTQNFVCNQYVYLAGFTVIYQNKFKKKKKKSNDGFGGGDEDMYSGRSFLSK